MRSHALLSALGRDRVGVADDLAKALSGRQIDIEHSRMAALRGRFALVLELSGQEANLVGLQHDLDLLEANLGFQLHFERLGSPPAVPNERQYRIEALSPGPSGVTALTALFKRHDINIEELETEATVAAWNSEVMFQIKARITVPPSCPIPTLRREVRELERERDVDVMVKQVPALVREPVV